MPLLESVMIPAAHGSLEGLLRLPDTPGEAAMAAVVCHPHPQFGGTMHNKVAFRIAQALVEVGAPTLRFNFRGVGRSSGTYDNGHGERDDVRTALDFVADRFPGLPLCLGGVSFGAWVGLPVGCADPRVVQLIGAGVPLRLLDVDALDQCDKAKLIVQGEHDEFGPVAALRPWFARLPEPKALSIIAGADHLFPAHQEDLQRALLSYLRSPESAIPERAR